MKINSRYTVTKILVAIVWILLGAGTVVLLVAAIEKRNNEKCLNIEITISGVQNNFFVDKKDVFAILEKTNKGKLENKLLHSIDMALMETQLQESPWIKEAELFFDNNNVLVVRITEREPIARVFTISGFSFYLDSSLTRLPLSDKFSARLPVFTNFPSDLIILSHADSNVLKSIRTLGAFIGSSPFWMAQIDQVDILPERKFDLIPKLGNQVIHFGKADNYNDKFNNLLCFYRQVFSKIGWNRYSAIDVQYKGQVVGVKRGVEEIKMDSLRSIQIMKAMIAEAQRQTDDSTHVQLEQTDDDSNINSSKEIDNTIDEESKVNNTNIKNTHSVPVTPIHVPEKPKIENHSPVTRNAQSIHSSSFEKPNPVPSKTKIIKPPVSKQDANLKEKPKALMPPKTDY
jgi:cell division protein FtsQ